MSLKANRFYGCHVSSSGGIVNAIHNGNELGVNTIQLHPSAPQRWNTSELTKEAVNEFNTAKESSCVKKVFFHAIYLINLASPDERQFKLSQKSVASHLNLATSINGDGVIVHVGSWKDQPDEESGLKRAALGINNLLKEANSGAPLLLEVAAGSGNIIGDRMEELANIYEMIEQKERVGFALDTQHMWASGYNWQESLEEIVEEIDSIFGLNKVGAIHFNDSMTPYASKKDRHENIGDGLIGKETMKSIFTHNKLSNIPFILETPSMKDLELAKGEVEKLKSFLTD